MYHGDLCLTGTLLSKQGGTVTDYQTKYLVWLWQSAGLLTVNIVTGKLSARLGKLSSQTQPVL
jgi:hypothetical protein